MVPMDRVEEELAEVVQQMAEAGHAHELAIAAVPDKAKGEKLLLLYTSLPCEPRELLEAASVRCRRGR